MSAKYTDFSQLPREVSEFLVSDEGQDQVLSLLEEHGVSEECVDDLYDLVEAVIFGETQPDDIPAAFAQAVGLSQAESKEMMMAFLSARLVPVADVVGVDIVGAMRRWGAPDQLTNDVKRVDVEHANNENDQTPRFKDPILQHRLELIVASYRDGVRTREQAVGVMRRSIKTGGLEMGERAANDVLDLARKIKGPNGPEEPEGPEDKEAPVIGGPTVGRRAAEGAKGTEVTGGPVIGGPTAGGRVADGTEDSVIGGPTAGRREGTGGAAKPDAFTEEDEAEARMVAEQKKAAMETPSLVTDTRAAAEKIAADAKLSFATGELKTRFEHIIDARLRDVRDGFETRAKLEAPVELGGLGLFGAQLVDVVEAAENLDAMHHKALAAQMEEKKRQARAERSEMAERSEKIQAKDAQVMAQRYAEITGKAPTELVEPMASRPTALPMAETVERRARQIDTSKVKEAIEAAKTPTATVRAVLSPASIPMASSGRPKVEDVRFERKLAGPVEELRLLTLVDFRRLSKDPTQAARKVRDKVELAAQEGYDRRIAAVRAWRESPLCQLYVSLSREALIAGKGIAQVLDEKRAAGEDVPSNEELKAVVELNGELRF
jgi:hypothetical protein